MTTVRSFSLGRAGEAQWEHLRGAYILSRRSGEIVLVASDSRDVRDEVRRRLEAMAPRVEVIEPGKGVTLAIHACAKARADGEKIPVAWIEAPPSSPSPESDMQWIEALVVLNQTRDALQMHGPCHVVLAGPRALHRLVTTRAPDLTSFMSIALLLDDTLENLVIQQGTLTWLHLSDLHVHSESWQQDHVLDALVRDLPKLLEERELRPDLLFVTGDVAARGQRAEYDGAFIVLEQITKLLGLDRRERVFVVPGNHDVERGRISGMAKGHHAWLMGLEPDVLRNAVGELMGDAKDFARYGDRLTEWCAFTDKFLGPARSVSSDRPWRSDVVDVGGLAVGVLSLCTAWASGPDDRKGSLILGERQIHDMVAEARDGGAHLKIVLMHHPLHWLHDGEYSAIRGRLEHEVDVVLHGHVHDAHSALHVASGSAHVEIGAGAAYGGLGQDASHGFSVGRLDLALGRLEVHCFTWTTRGGKWHADAGAPGADDRGRVSLPFKPEAIAPEVAQRGGLEVLATRLRHAAAKVYATADFAGLGAGGPRKHVTWEQIFVPLHLTAEELEGSLSQWVEQDEEPADDQLELHDETSPGEGEEQFPDDYVESDAYEFVSGRVSMEGLEGMLAAGHRIVVLGGPGSGKSTLTKVLASTIARRDGGLVPLLLTVRAWIAEDKREDLLDMAARQATTELSVRTDRMALEALCEEGRALLLVDGVDEAADAAVRRDLRNRVHAFVTRFPRVPVLVTSRIAGYHEVPLDDEDFIELTLEPFDDDSLEQFVRRWYDLVEDDPAARLRKRVDLLHALEVEPRAKELARNPLLATLIGMVHFSHAQLPGDRAKLYGMMIELLLVTWPAERRRELPELHGTVQQPMLEKLALQLQQQRARSSGDVLEQLRGNVLVDITDLDEMLVPLLSERFPERGAHELRHLAREWRKQLVDGSGLLQEQQPGRLSFLHLSLMEFLAGRALLEQCLGNGFEAVAALVVELHAQPVWRETLLLMLGSESKKRELIQVVVERLLNTRPEWWTCLFGLALLRDEVDLGAMRTRLFEATRDAALAESPRHWRQASQALAQVVHFSRMHGTSTRAWLKAEIETAENERLLGTWALASEVFRESEIESWIEARSDARSAIQTFLELGPLDRVGQWARQHSSRDIALAWARATPRDGIFARSFEGVDGWMGAIWIPQFIERAGWFANATMLATQGASGRGDPNDRSRMPAVLEWEADHVACARVWIPTSMSFLWRTGVAKSRAGHFQRYFAQYSSDAFAERFAPRLALDVFLHFSLSLAAYVENDGELAAHVGRDCARDFMQKFAHGYLLYHSQSFERGLAAVNSDRLHLQIDLSRSVPDISPPRLRGALTLGKLDEATTRILPLLIAEAHAALLIAPGLLNMRLPLRIVHTLIRVRIQNRWLNLFFTPLVDYATQSRPLASHPDLHALLLTYGLIQYQTTWEWPDCPHWRSWFASDPPTHWLPAHVWHLVRSIQDPQNPTHRQQADAALDRNDWPELAQALRETTLIPTPPEVLALFDHGDNPDDLPPPSTPT